MLNQLQNAVESFKTVCKKQPQNVDAREKYNMTLKNFREDQLRKAVEREDVKVEINAEDIVVEGSYTGPKFENTDEIDPAWVESLMEW